MTLSRKDWLKLRQQYLTASDVSAVLHRNPWRTPLDVYVSKVTEPVEMDTDATFMGRAMEEPIAQLYEKKIGRRVENIGETELQVHQDIPWLAATLDRLIYVPGSLQGVPLEIKHSGLAAHWTDSAPIYVQIQLQTQIACVDSKWGAVAAWVNRFYTEDFDRNDRFLEAAYPTLERFWDRVQRRDQPPAESPADIGALKALYSEDDGDTVELTEDDLETANELEDARQQIPWLEARIREAIGQARFGMLPDGTMLVAKTITREDGVKYRQIRRKRV